MVYKSELAIKGLQRAQQKNIKRIHAVDAKGKLGKAIKAIMIPAYRFLVTVTHVDTGSYKASQRMEYKGSGDQAQGTLYVDPSAVNPRSNMKVKDYSKYEEARGGDHASYSRTVDFINNSGLLRHGVQMVRGGLSG